MILLFQWKKWLMIERHELCRSTTVNVRSKKNNIIEITSIYFLIPIVTVTFTCRLKSEAFDDGTDSITSPRKWYWHVPNTCEWGTSGVYRALCDEDLSSPIKDVSNICDWLCNHPDHLCWSTDQICLRPVSVVRSVLCLDQVGGVSTSFHTRGGHVRHSCQQIGITILGYFIASYICITYLSMCMQRLLTCGEHVTGSHIYAWTNVLLVTVIYNEAYTLFNQTN